MAERGAYLLVADDNKVNRLLLSRSLEQQGHRVALALDGRQALEMLKRENFDALLLDIEMPVMDGFEVLAAMKADRALRDLETELTRAAGRVLTPAYASPEQRRNMPRRIERLVSALVTGKTARR